MSARLGVTAPCPSRTWSLRLLGGAWAVPIPPRTAWLVTTSLVKSMPSGSGICTPFLVLSAGRERCSEAESHCAPAPSPAVCGQRWCLPLMMGMIVSCSRVFSGACSENSWGKRSLGERSGSRPACPGRACLGLALGGLEGVSCDARPLPEPAPCCGWGLAREAGPPGLARVCSPLATPAQTAWSRCETCRGESSRERGAEGTFPAASAGPQQGPYRRRSSCTRSAFPCRNTLALSLVS